MNERAHEQLDKILALADSSHDGEAVVAVRKARQILTRDGLSFGDLARAATVGASYASKSPALRSFLSGQRDHMDMQQHHLRQQIDDLRAQMQTQDLQLDFWRRRAMDMEAASQHAQSEAERWKKLASETADRLWEIGKSIGADGLASQAAVPSKLAAAVVKK